MSITSELKPYFQENLLRMGDNALILGQQLSKWCGHGPILEEDIALTNLALDLVGQATALLDYAGQVEGQGRTGDDFAFHRDVMNFRNSLLVEQDNGDFGKTILRQFFFASYAFHLNEALSTCSDETLAGIASKSVKELKYHLRHSAQWVIRLAGGTDESRKRIEQALEQLWKYTGDMFEPIAGADLLMKANLHPNLQDIKAKWFTTVAEVFEEAGLAMPEEGWQMKGSVLGQHTEKLGFILAEMQFYPRTYPKAIW